MEILKEIKNELFKRSEISVVVESEKNPGFDAVKKMISEKIGKPEENIEVYNVKSSFGSNKFKIGAYVYDSKDDLEKAVQKTQKQRKQEKEAEKTAKEEAKKKAEEVVGDKPAEDKVEEKPAEVPAEERVEEEKTEVKPSEAPVEDKPEEEVKAVKEEKQAKEEAKE